MALTADLWLSAHTAHPGFTGANEADTASWPAYARVPAVAAQFSIQIGMLVQNIAPLALPPFTGDAALTISHLGFWDAPQGGSFRCAGVLTLPKALQPGDRPMIRAGELTVELVSRGAIGRAAVAKQHPFAGTRLEEVDATAVLSWHTLHIGSRRIAVLSASRAMSPALAPRLMVMPPDLDVSVGYQPRSMQ